MVRCHSGFGTGGKDIVTEVTTKYDNDTGKPYRLIWCGEHAFDLRTGNAWNSPTAYFIDDVICTNCGKVLDTEIIQVFVHTYGLSPPQRFVCSKRCHDEFTTELDKKYREAHTPKKEKIWLVGTVVIENSVEAYLYQCLDCKRIMLSNDITKSDCKYCDMSYK